MAKLGKIYQDEHISFNYSSTWREQDPKTRGPSCIKALAKVANELPSTITIYKYVEKSKKTTNELLEELRDSFTNQGWDIINSEIGSIDGVDAIKIISNAEIEGKTLRLHVTFLFHNNSMFIFELTSFPEAENEINEYNTMVNSLIFLN